MRQYMRSGHFCYKKAYIIYNYIRSFYLSRLNICNKTYLISIYFSFIYTYNNDNKNEMYKFQ